MEIERKFLLATLPAGLEEGVFIRQGYLVNHRGREVRLRQKGTDYFLTVKDGSGLERQEREIALTPDQFATLWPLTEGHRVEKTRHLLRWEGWVIEVDLYHGPLSPLQVAEVEFSSLQESAAFAKPAFLGEEVTGLARYSNASLAGMAEN